MLHLSIVHPQHIHDGILLSPKKGNETESAVVMTWMDLEPVVKVRKRKTSIVYSHINMRNLGKNGTDDLICRAGREMQT